MTGDLNHKIESAISLIKTNVPPEGYWVAFSGGKDSVVAYDLVKRSGVKHDTHFNQTTIDPPEIYAFVKKNYPEVIWEKPKRSMFAAIKSRQIPPTRRVRYCCAELKELHGENRVMVTGVRNSESTARQARTETDHTRHNTSTTYVNPIVSWSEQDVWDYIRSNHIEYCSLYNEGYTRIGCIMCPLQGRYGMCKDALRFPKHYAAYLKAFGVLLNNCHVRKPDKINDLKWKSAEDVMFWWIYGIHRCDNKKPHWKLPFDVGFDLEAIRPRSRRRKVLS